MRTTHFRHKNIIQTREAWQVHRSKTEQMSRGLRGRGLRTNTTYGASTRNESIFLWKPNEWQVHHSDLSGGVSDSYVLFLRHYGQSTPLCREDKTKWRRKINGCRTVVPVEVFVSHSKKKCTSDVIISTVNSPTFTVVHKTVTSWNKCSDLQRQNTLKSTPLWPDCQSFLILVLPSRMERPLKEIYYTSYI